MSSFLKRTTNINLIVILLTITISSAQEKIILPIKETDFKIGRENRNKLIDTYEDALKIGLDKETKNPKIFYKNNAVYLFDVGGGCFGAVSSEISIELCDNLVSINWIEPQEPCPEVGEEMAYYGKIIISKKEFPNYRRFKFKYYWED